MLESLGNRLRMVRTELGKKEAEAATAVGITQPMLHRAETSLGVSSNRLFQSLDYYVNQRNVNAAWLLKEPNTNISIFWGE